MAAAFVYMEVLRDAREHAAGERARADQLNARNIWICRGLVVLGLSTMCFSHLYAKEVGQKRQLAEDNYRRRVKNDKLDAELKNARESAGELKWCMKAFEDFKAKSDKCDSELKGALESTGGLKWCEKGFEKSELAFKLKSEQYDSDLKDERELQGKLQGRIESLVKSERKLGEMLRDSAPRWAFELLAVSALLGWVCSPSVRSVSVRVKNYFINQKEDSPPTNKVQDIVALGGLGIAALSLLWTIFTSAATPAAAAR